MTKRNKLVLVSGNLGAGKTTLAKKIGERLNWFIGYESVIDNPYLSDFYSDMNTWSYHLQIYFLGKRSNQHIIASNTSQNAILDRSIYEDSQIFAKGLYQSGNLSSRDYESYKTLFELVTKDLRPPDLLIYVQAPLQTLLKRIKTRGQEFDKNLSVEYLEMIDSLYTEWISNFNICPVLRIDSEKYNYLENDQDLNSIINQLMYSLHIS